MTKLLIGDNPKGDFKVRKGLSVLLVISLLILPGCIGGGGSKSDPVSHSEINSFFALYAYRFETGDLDGVLDMYQLPVKATYEGSSVEVTITELSDLSDMMADNLEMRTSYNTINIQAIVESVTGTTSNALAKVIIIAEGFDDSGKTIITSKVQYGLVKSSGKWRIRSEHWIDQNERWEP